MEQFQGLLASPSIALASCHSVLALHASWKMGAPDSLLLVRLGLDGET